MVRTIDLKPSKDSTIIDFSTNCRCQMTQNLLNVFCSEIAVHEQFLGDRSEKCLFTSTPNAMSRHLTPNIVRPTMADRSTWLYGKSSHLYYFRISAQEIIDVESIKIMATNFCFSPKNDTYFTKPPHVISTPMSRKISYCLFHMEIR